MSASSHKQIKIFSDGGARGNPGPAAIGVLLCDTEGKKITEYAQVIGEATNNVAEYSAIIKGLDLARDLGAHEIDYFLDSELAAKQLSGEYRVKTPHILELFLKVKSLEKDFKKIIYTHVPRTHEKIKYVDKLVNIALNRAGH